MKGLIQAGAISFAIIAFLLVSIVTISNGLSIMVIIKRSLLATILFGILGGLLMYLLGTFVFFDNQQKDSQDSGKTQMKAVSQQTAAQQYQQEDENEEDVIDDEAEEDFQPLDLEEIDYEEQDEINKLAEENPEKLAQMLKSVKEN